MSLLQVADTPTNAYNSTLRLKILILKHLKVMIFQASSSTFDQVETRLVLNFIICAHSFDWQTFFVQVFCTSLNGYTYETKYRLYGDKSAGLVKLAK